MDQSRYVGKRPSYPEIKKEGTPGYAAIKGWTLHGPAAAGDESQCRRLIQQCAEVDCRDENGWTPLRWAIQYGKGKVIDLLLKSGADPNARFDKNKTCLHYTAYQMKQFACNGVRLCIEIRRGEIASQYTRGKQELCVKLLAAGAVSPLLQQDDIAWTKQTYTLHAHIPQHPSPPRHRTTHLDPESVTLKNKTGAVLCTKDTLRSPRPHLAMSGADVRCGAHRKSTPWMKMASHHTT
eukprot:920237-Rhodomonas_salina.1